MLLVEPNILVDAAIGRLLLRLQYLSGEKAWTWTGATAMATVAANAARQSSAIAYDNLVLPEDAYLLLLLILGWTQLGIY